MLRSCPCITIGADPGRWRVPLDGLGRHGQDGRHRPGVQPSSAATGDYPSIYYAGQTAGDPLGTTETEALIKQGSGSQTDTSDRWGDYSSMTLDGNDSCTFWYTTEYYPVTGRFSWATWLASLKFPNCR